jgi:hypothetical protein
MLSLVAPGTANLPIGAHLPQRAPSDSHTSRSASFRIAPPCPYAARTFNAASHKAERILTVQCARSLC